MKSEVVFNLEVNLARFSAIAAAVDFWERPYVKKERVKFFKKYVEQYSFQDLYVKWKEVRDFALKYLKNLNLSLPEKASSLLESMMVYVGDKLFDWMSYIVKSNSFELQCVDKIYWTPVGTVNDVKILRRFWRKDPTFPGWRRDMDVLDEEDRYLLKLVFFNMCCIYAAIDVIESDKVEIIKVLKMNQFYGSEVRIKGTTPFEIMGMLFCVLLSDRHNKKAGELYTEVFYISRIPPPVSLFFGASEAAADRAMEYFYGKMTQADRDKYLPHAACKMLCQIFETDANGSIHKKERLTSCILFVINHMSEEEKSKYLLERGVDVCKIFIEVPPYDKLCQPMLEYVWNKFPKDNHNRMKERLLKFTCNLLKNFPETCHPSKKEVQQQFFEFLMGRSDKSIKKKVILDKRTGLLLKLYKLEDFRTLNIILKDDDLAFAKKEILAVGTPMFQNLVEKGYFEMADKHLSKMIPDPKERAEFKSQLKFTSKILINGQVELAEKFLKWASTSRKEKKKLKNLINPFDVSSDLIRRGLYNLANDYIKWQLDYSVEDQNFVKLDLRSKILLREICRVWCEEPNGTGNAKTKCNQLLKFFTISNEKTEIVEDDEEFVRMFFKNAPLDSIRVIEDLLRYSLKSPDRIKEVKQKIAADIDSWIEFFSVMEKKFLIANSIIHWLFKGNKKEAVITNYINSSKGAELCVQVLTGKTKESLEMALAVYNSWVKRFGDVTQIKNHLANIYGSNSKDKIVVGAKNLLDKLKAGDEIKSSHVKSFMKIESDTEDDDWDYYSSDDDFDHPCGPPCRQCKLS